MPTHFSPSSGSSTARAILDAAAQLFIQKGYRKVTTREIAAAADVNLGLIPYYYTSKENLAASVMRDANDRAYAEVFRTLPKDLGCAEQLYLSTLLLWKQFSDDAMVFFLEYLECCGYTRVSETFEQMAEAVLVHYDLHLAPQKHALFLHALKGAESQMLIARNKGDLQTSQEEISRVILTNYFYNIGLSETQIRTILANCESYMEI